MKLLIILCAAFLNSACLAQVIPSGKDEVVFVRDFREPGWLYYTTTNSARLSSPVLITLDVYEVLYRLTPDSLLISKRPYSGRGLPSILYAQLLDKADSQQVIELLAAAQPALLDESIVDDGLAVKITLAGHNNTFYLIADKEPAIMDLLDIVDKLAPKKYGFRDYIPKPNDKW